MAWDHTKIPAIANAQIVCYRWNKSRVVSGAIQKAVLWTMWFFEGQRVRRSAVAARAGTSEAGADLALVALVRKGILIQLPGPRCRAQAYRIDVQRLEALRSDEAIAAEPALFAGMKQGR